jgi:trk system potassium uptake protein TrkH
MLLGLAMVGGGVATCAGGVKLLRVHALLPLAGASWTGSSTPVPSPAAGPSGGGCRAKGAYMAWVFFMFFAIAIFVVTGALTLAGLDFTRAWCWPLPR